MYSMYVFSVGDSVSVITLAGGMKLFWCAFPMEEMLFFYGGSCPVCQAVGAVENVGSGSLIFVVH